MDDEKKQKTMRGAKCKPCCYSGHCWNSLNTLRRDCSSLQIPSDISGGGAGAAAHQRKHGRRLRSAEKVISTSGSIVTPDEYLMGKNHD